MRSCAIFDVGSLLRAHACGCKSNRVKEHVRHLRRSRRPLGATTLARQESGPKPCPTPRKDAPSIAQAPESSPPDVLGGHLDLGRHARLDLGGDVGDWHLELAEGAVRLDVLPLVHLVRARMGDGCRRRDRHRATFDAQNGTRERYAPQPRPRRVVGTPRFSKSPPTQGGPPDLSARVPLWAERKPWLHGTS